MNRPILVCVAALSSCTSKPDAGCPAIERLAHSDAAVDARTALEKGDQHLLMLGGFVGEVPGVSNPGSFPTQMMESTSDVESEDCSRLRTTAVAYAIKYNRIIVEGSTR
jgi:hypothetical protein